MQLARRKRPWPALALPQERGAITAADVLAALAGAARDQAISDWCRSVSEAYRHTLPAIAQLLQEQGIA